MATIKPIWSDISAVMGANPLNGDIPIITDVASVKFAVKSLVLTNYYERPFHSEIGSPLKRLLFENITDILVITLKQSISDIIVAYEPRVNLIDVIVNARPDDNYVYVAIQFSIKNTTKLLQVDVALERTR